MLEYIAHVSLAPCMLGSAPCWVSPCWAPWWAGTMGDEKTNHNHAFLTFKPFRAGGIRLCSSTIATQRDEKKEGWILVRFSGR